jgi:cytochrome c oxidase subunit 2
MKKIELMVIGAELIVTIGIIVTFLALGQGPVIAAAPVAQGEQVISISAKKFSYTPPQVVLKKGVPVVLELTSLDRQHGFRLEELGIRADVKPGETTRVRLVPQKAGQFSFACDVFCGSGHEDMAGEIIVVD